MNKSIQNVSTYDVLTHRFPRDYRSVTRVINCKDVRLLRIFKSLTHLEFGCDFNQKLNVGDIPNTVTHLIFPSYYDYKLTRECIPNVEYLEIRGKQVNMKRLVF